MQNIFDLVAISFLDITLQEYAKGRVNKQIVVRLIPASYLSQMMFISCPWNHYKKTYMHHRRVVLEGKLWHLRRE